MLSILFSMFLFSLAGAISPGPVTMTEVAGLSPDHLILHFKHAYGQTPHAFQLDQRINRGKQLLKQEQAIVDVTLQLGFADQSHFQRHFKSSHALTPLAYKNPTGI